MEIDKSASEPASVDHDFGGIFTSKSENKYIINGRYFCCKGKEKGKTIYFYLLEQNHCSKYRRKYTDNSEAKYVAKFWFYESMHINFY